ncbi:MAG: nucleotidyl transferase AbiEii/AbiGii toxin family protein [Candidatus Woesearchaeota archaeon]
MKKEDIRKYISKLKKSNNLSVNDYFLEKDYVLSLFLSNWEKQNTPNLDKLVFKGGTLLTKNYLKYHRISEDLDFTHKDSNIIRNMSSKNKLESYIKKLVLPIIDEIKILCDLSNLTFEKDRTNDKFIEVRNSRKLYVFKLWYKSLFTGIPSFIKFEISFVEDLIFETSINEVKNILDYYPIDEVDLKIMKYDVVNSNILVYSLEEIVLEKIRACLTRPEFQVRDVFDLFLINKKFDVLKFEDDSIFRKLSATPFEHDLVLLNLKNFLSREIVLDLDDVLSLSLVDFDEKEFEIFFEGLILYLKRIAKDYLIKFSEPIN